VPRSLPTGCVDPGADGDGDGYADLTDNCPGVSNATQADADGDGLGDACDPCPADPLNDGDGDGICGATDNCPSIANPQQEDRDLDGLGDVCDPDVDGDGVPNGADCSPLDPVLNAPPAPLGAALAFADASGGRLTWPFRKDGRVASVYTWSFDASGFKRQDTCLGSAPAATGMDVPLDPPPGIFFGYLVSFANACGSSGAGVESGGAPRKLKGRCFQPGQDSDGDGCDDLSDNCPLLPNPSQQDTDGDGVGDACPQP
jgi:hypothetical protein